MNETKKKDEKTFFFPENVESSYGVFLGLSVKEMLVYILPMVIVGLIVLFLPPHTFKFMIFKGIVVIFSITVLLAVLSSRPVSYRNNVRLMPHLQMKSKYKSRQHLFFKKAMKRK